MPLRWLWLQKKRPRDGKNHGEMVIQWEISDQNGVIEAGWTIQNRHLLRNNPISLCGPKVTRLGTTKVWGSQFHCEGEEMIGHNSRVHDAIIYIYIYITHVYTYIGNSFKIPLIKHMYETIIQCQTNVQTRCKNLRPTASLTSEGQSWHSPLSSDVEYFTQVFWIWICHMS